MLVNEGEPVPTDAILDHHARQLMEWYRQIGDPRLKDKANALTLTPRPKHRPPDDEDAWLRLMQMQIVHGHAETPNRAATMVVQVFENQIEGYYGEHSERSVIERLRGKYVSETDWPQKPPAKS